MPWTFHLNMFRFAILVLWTYTLQWLMSRHRHYHFTMWLASGMATMLLAKHETTAKQCTCWGVIETVAKSLWLRLLNCLVPCTGGQFQTHNVGPGWMLPRGQLHAVGHIVVPGDD